MTQRSLASRWIHGHGEQVGPIVQLSCGSPRSTGGGAMKPLRAIRLRSGGRCGCTACINDELAAEALRDVAVVQSVISPARAAQGEGAGRVEAPARVITRASAFSTSKLAPVAALGMGTGAVQLRVGVVAAPVLSTLSREAR